MVSQGIRSSTKRTYSSVQNKYLSFCNSMGLPPVPASETLILRFIAFISATVSHQSVPVYLAAVKSLHVMAGFEDPPINSPRVQLMVRSMAQFAPPPSQAKPISFHMLASMGSFLSSTWDDNTQWVGMTLAFFACLRAGEFTVPSPNNYDPRSLVRVQDLKFVTTAQGIPALVLVIKRTKTAPQGVQLVIGCSFSPICAYCSMVAYCGLKNIVSTASNPQPLLSWVDGSPLDKPRFVARMKQLLAAAGYDPKGYSGHSWHSGSASQGISNGWAPLCVKTHGRWRSDAFHRYIRLSDDQLAQFASGLVPSSRKSNPFHIYNNH